MEFNGIKLRRGVWYNEKQGHLIIITSAEVRDFINIKTFKKSRHWAVNCYLPQYAQLIKGVRLINYDNLVRIGDW